MRRPRSATGRAGGRRPRPRVRLAPLSASEADAMIRDLPTFPLLDGYRGRPRAAAASLREVVLRVGLAEDLPEIGELDLNPVLVGVDGAQVVDARVRVEPRDPGGPRGRPPAAAPPEEE